MCLQQEQARTRQSMVAEILFWTLYAGEFSRARRLEKLSLFLAIGLEWERWIRRRCWWSRTSLRRQIQLHIFHSLLPANFDAPFRCSAPLYLPLSLIYSNWTWIENTNLPYIKLNAMRVRSEQIGLYLFKYFLWSSLLICSFLYIFISPDNYTFNFNTRNSI